MRVLRSVVIRSEACAVIDGFVVKHRFHALAGYTPRNLNRLSFASSKQTSVSKEPQS